MYLLRRRSLQASAEAYTIFGWLLTIEPYLADDADFMVARSDQAWPAPGRNVGIANTVVNGRLSLRHAADAAFQIAVSSLKHLHGLQPYSGLRLAAIS